MLQPFPPPAPPASLTPTSSPSPNYGPVINRDKVRDALLLLAQIFTEYRMQCKGTAKASVCHKPFMFAVLGGCWITWKSWKNEGTSCERLKILKAHDRLEVNASDPGRGAFVIVSF
ncbi:hypothetical protein CK203_073520 [Vitis vinifera]|uniref:Uncharacterized protein n=1 Tax=Vitis vinifera TaxID=29760 RepID=A0A438EJY6_VITVI|nr:hypothetical protein CK203_073520 [Vitis vinifera]